MTAFGGPENAGVPNIPRFVSCWNDFPYMIKEQKQKRQFLGCFPIKLF